MPHGIRRPGRLLETPANVASAINDVIVILTFFMACFRSRSFHGIIHPVPNVIKVVTIFFRLHLSLACWHMDELNDATWGTRCLTRGPIPTVHVSPNHDELCMMTPSLS